MRARRLLVFRVGALTFGIALVLGVGEAALRLLRPLDLGTSHMHRIPHPERGWSLEPDISYVNRVGPILVPVHYSSEGWRDVLHPLPKPPDETRIIVLGDSFMEGYSVRLEELMARRLEDDLRTHGLDTRVVNLGVGGYGTLQELITFRTVGVDHEPSFVLLGFYENDLQNNLRDLEIQAAGAGHVKVDSRPFLVEGDAFAISEIDYPGALRRFEANRLANETDACERVKRSSALAQQLDRAGRGLADSLRTATAMVSAVWRRATGLLNADAEKERMASRQKRRDLCNSRLDRAWTITERVLAQLDADVSMSGAQLIVFSVPSFGGVAYEVVGESPSRTVGDCTGGTTPSRLAMVTSRLGIAFVDLFPAFHARADGEPRSLFHAADQHWNTAGHALASKVLADAIVGARASTQSSVGTKPTPLGASRSE